MFLPDSISEGWAWPVLKLLAAVWAIHFAARPWVERLCAGFPDRGAGLRLPVGLFTYALLCRGLWLQGLFPPSPAGAWLLVALLASTGRLLPRRRPPSAGTRSRMRSAALRSSLIFHLLIAYWTLIRTADPGADHTEQPMNTMWMRGAMASGGPPLRDAWHAGAPASYYADGHQLLAFWTLPAGVPPAVAVNLGQILLFALCGVLVFEAGRLLARHLRLPSANGVGLLSLWLLLMVSTLPGFTDALDPSDPQPWWWRASRVLSDGQTELITEFPFFSFWLGDNHAHVLGLPVLLLSLIHALHWLRVRRIHFVDALPAWLGVFWSWGINPWQFPLALALPAGALVLRGRRLTRREVGALLLAGLSTCWLLLPGREGGPTISLAFNRGGHTSLREAFLVFGFLLPGLCGLIRLRPHRPLWLLLGLAAGLYVATEWVYLEDAFQNRMNTLFKTYYQIWILLSVAAAAGYATLLRTGGWLRGPLRTVGGLLLLAGGVYALRLSEESLRSPRPRSLHAWRDWPREQVQLLHIADALIHPGERIAEAPGSSYRADHNLLGTWTAGDSLAGWAGHQRQWRADFIPPDPSPLYTARDADELDRALAELKPDWLLLGPVERARFLPSPAWSDWMDARAYREFDGELYRLYRLRAPQGSLVLQQFGNGEQLLP